jgi:hypothetical protein
LRVVVWRGVVQRRGAPRSKTAAQIVDELVLTPVEASVSDQRWQAADGTRYTTATLAAKSLALLKEQVGKHD